MTLFRQIVALRAQNLSVWALSCAALSACATDEFPPRETVQTAECISAVVGQLSPDGVAEYLVLTNAGPMYPSVSFQVSDDAGNQILGQSEIIRRAGQDITFYIYDDLNDDKAVDLTTPFLENFKRTVDDRCRVRARFAIRRTRFY